MERVSGQGLPFFGLSTVTKPVAMKWHRALTGDVGRGVGAGARTSKALTNHAWQKYSDQAVYAAEVITIAAAETNAVSMDGVAGEPR